jgi:hypothetical protein
MMHIENGIIHKGSLKKVGYSPKESVEHRHTALRKAVRAYGKPEVIKKLNAVATLTKNSQPENSRKYHEDATFVGDYK